MRERVSRWLRTHRASLAVGALLGVAGFFFWSTVLSTSQARIVALWPVEVQAFAVYEQVIRNLGVEGEVFQTIHRGYDDHWTWSGHRSLTLFVVAWIYRLAPGAEFLAQIQLFAVWAGVVPAALLGRRHAGAAGAAWAGLIYLAMPSTAAIALQDYQDLALALPLLVFAAWCLGTGRWPWVLVGAVAGMLPREECLVAVVALAVACPPLKRGRPRWARWGLQVLVVAGLAAGLAWALTAESVASSSGYTPSVGNALGDLFNGMDVPLWGWPDRWGFYADIWSPAGLLAAFDPLAACAALGLELLHMTLPGGAGIDRRWGGHSHHMAPAAAFALVATISGGGRLMGLLGRRGWLGLCAAVVVGVGSLLSTLKLAETRAEELNLRVTAWPVGAAWQHPAWRLAAQLPDDAIPVTSRRTSLTVSNRRVAYTFDESLELKSQGRGLGAATHLIVSARCDEMVQRARAMEGAVQLDADDGFVLLSWTAGARDPSAAPVARGTRRPKARCGSSERYFGPHRGPEDIPGVAPSGRFDPPVQILLPHIAAPSWLRRR